MNALEPLLSRAIEEKRDLLLYNLSKTLANHALDNVGQLRSTRHANEVAEQFLNLLANFVNQSGNGAAIQETAAEFARRGMVLNTGAQLARALQEIEWLEDWPTAELQTAATKKLVDFELKFVTQLALAREGLLLEDQEKVQQTLQKALHSQLHQQRQLRVAQERYNQRLRKILQLSASLAEAEDETALMEQAVTGIGQALELLDATIVAGSDNGRQWSIRASAAADLSPDQPAPEALAHLLNDALKEDGEQVKPHKNEDGAAGVRIAVTFPLRQQSVGGIIAATDNAEQSGDILILLKAFAQNLGPLWRNTELLRETRRWAQELEILHGRYMDSIWHTDTASTFAYFENGRLNIQHASHSPKDDSAGRDIPLVVGDHPFGNVTLPAGVRLEDQDAEFLQSLIREMGNALHNAYLLQATRSYSTQLQLAAQVSRAASATLDRERLIREVVGLIQESFNLYYIGLFLLDEPNYAVLKAGTGEAGRRQIEQGHKLPIDGSSMISQAILQEEAQVENDVAQSRSFQRNPLLPDTRSELALPLRTRGQTIGALTVQSARIGEFSDENITVLQSLADQLGTAIENASLFAQVERSLAETARLYHAGQIITAAEDTETVYQALVDFAAQSGLVDMAHIVTLDPESPDYVMISAAWSRIGIELLPERDRIALDKFSTARMLAQNKVIVMADGQTDEQMDRAGRLLLKRNKLHGCALLPIHTENQWLATLGLYNREKKILTETELQPFLTLCDQAGVILANQRLLAEKDALYHIGRSLNQAISQEDALEATVNEVAAYAGLEQCRVVLYDHHRQIGRIAAERRPSPEEAAGAQLPQEGDYVYHYLLEHREPLLLEANDESDPAKTESIRRLLTPFGIQASLVIPAFSQHELIGFLTLDSFGSTRPFTKANQNFAQTVIEQLTTTIESLKLFDEALARAQELISLNQAGARISGTLDLRELAQVVYEQAGLLLDNSFFILALYNPADELCEPMLCISEGQEYEAEAQKVAPEGPLHKFLYNNMPYMGDEPSELSLEIEPLAPTAYTQPPQSSLWAPLQQEGKPAGFICLQSPERRAYAENHVQLLRSMATQTSLAITNARLFQQTQENVSELRLLFSITQAAAGSIDFEARVENMVDALHNSLQQADIDILLVNETADRLELLTARGDGPHPPERDLDEGLIGQVVQLGQPLMVNDLEDIPEFHQEDTLSQLVVPLTLGRRTVGVINVSSPQKEAFTERDLRILQTISVSLAATVESSRLFQEIQLANERLRELDRLKTQFLANMSHELRTPLNSIIGFSRVILKGIDGPITPEQEEDLTSIHNSGQHLLSLINDILDLAKIEAGKIALAFEMVNLGEIAQSVMATARGLVKDKPVRLTQYIEPNLPEVEADPVRLRQILLNFLSNAARFTDQGEIKLSIERLSAKEIQISVSDTGTGIGEEDYEKIFVAFEQADSSPTRAIDGTGLGLPITKRLVELHQGRVWFESHLGQGSTFYFTLPLSQDEETLATLTLPQPADPSAQSDNGRQESDDMDENLGMILVIDDEPGVADLYERYLRQAPYQLIRAHNGQEALDRVARYKEQLSAILLDINMPDLDGWDVLRVIRNIPEMAATPVIVCSIENEPEKADSLGAQALLPKPILEDDLLEALREAGIESA